MKKLLLIALSSMLFLSGCSFDIRVEPTQTAYVYKKDITESTRYNPGSDYEMRMPFATNYQMLVIDYGTTTADFKIDYTLTDKENKTRVEANAIITYQLIRNKDDNPDLQYSDDPIAQYYTKNIKATQYATGRYIISPEDVFNRLMNETLDKVFRSEYTNQKLYPDFDAIESSVTSMRDRIKTELISSAKSVNIEIIGLSISSPVVPEPILVSRNNMLALQQESLNTTKELEIKSALAAGRMAVETRDSINAVLNDRITTGNVNMAYLLIKAINRSIDEKAPINLTITPDLMRYLENDNNKSLKDKNDDALFEKLNGMTNKELTDYFNR